MIKENANKKVMDLGKGRDFETPFVYNSNNEDKLQYPYRHCFIFMLLCDINLQKSLLPKTKDKLTFYILTSYFTRRVFFQNHVYYFEVNQAG